MKDFAVFFKRSKLATKFGRLVIAINTPTKAVSLHDQKMVKFKSSHDFTETHHSSKPYIHCTQNDTIQYDTSNNKPSSQQHV